MKLTKKQIMFNIVLLNIAILDNFFKYYFLTMPILGILLGEMIVLFIKNKEKK